MIIIRPQASGLRRQSRGERASISSTTSLATAFPCPPLRNLRVQMLPDWDRTADQDPRILSLRCHLSAQPNFALSLLPFSPTRASNYDGYSRLILSLFVEGRGPRGIRFQKQASRFPDPPGPEQIFLSQDVYPRTTAGACQRWMLLCALHIQFSVLRCSLSCLGGSDDAKLLLWEEGCCGTQQTPSAKACKRDPGRVRACELASL